MSVKGVGSCGDAVSFIAFVLSKSPSSERRFRPQLTTDRRASQPGLSDRLAHMRIEDGTHNSTVDCDANLADIKNATRGIYTLPPWRKAPSHLLLMDDG